MLSAQTEPLLREAARRFLAGRLRAGAAAANDAPWRQLRLVDLWPARAPRAIEVRMPRALPAGQCRGGRISLTEAQQHMTPRFRQMGWHLRVVPGDSSCFFHCLAACLGGSPPEWRERVGVLGDDPPWADEAQLTLAALHTAKVFVFWPVEITNLVAGVQRAAIRRIPKGVPNGDLV